MEETEFTRDTLLRGRVQLLQPRGGFRSSLDPVLLAGFIAPPFGQFLDIGCATGALSFLLLTHDRAAQGLGIEIQPRLATLAKAGIETNTFADRFSVIEGDVRVKGVVPIRAFDLVATNPPFRPVGTGVLPPLSEKAMANHEVTLTLHEWLAVAAKALRSDGRLATIFPYDRWEELREELALQGFFVARLRRVVPRSGERPNRMLVEARITACEISEGSPLVVHDQGGYSTEVRRMLGEEEKKTTESTEKTEANES